MVTDGSAMKKRDRAELEATTSTKLAEPNERAGANDWASVAAHFILIVMLGGVLYGYHGDTDATKLGIALTAVVIALVATRFDRIKKLTSKLVSFETQPAVQQANAATKRANSAAQAAQKKADAAQDAASDASRAAAEAKAELARIASTLAQLSSTSQAFTKTLFESIARQGRLGALPSPEARLSMARDAEALLRTAGTPEEAIIATTKTLRASIRFDLARAVLEAAVTQIPEPARQAAFGKRGHALFPFQGGTFPRAQEGALRALLKEFELPVDREPLNGLLRRLEHYERTEELLPVAAATTEADGVQLG